jgi:tetratricopeptide (TPR) repeat protein
VLPEAGRQATERGANREGAVLLEQACAAIEQLPESRETLEVALESLGPLGRFAEAARRDAEATRLAEGTQNPYARGIAHLAAGRMHLYKGDWAEGLGRSEAGIAIFRAGQVDLLLPALIASTAWALAQLGETREALNRYEESRALLEPLAASGFPQATAWVGLALGHACLRLGRLDEARSLADRVVASCPAQYANIASVLGLRGDIASHPDHLDAENAEADYRDALALARPARSPTEPP